MERANSAGSRSFTASKWNAVRAALPSWTIRGRSGAHLSRAAHQRREHQRKGHTGYTREGEGAQGPQGTPLGPRGCAWAEGGAARRGAAPRVLVGERSPHALPWTSLLAAALRCCSIRLILPRGARARRPASPSGSPVRVAGAYPTGGDP